jgi:hypothetical protein
MPERGPLGAGPDQFETTVNLRTAKALDIPIPSAGAAGRRR